MPEVDIDSPETRRSMKFLYKYICIYFVFI